MKPALLTVDRDRLTTIEQALRHYLDNQLGAAMRDVQYFSMTQPKETVALYAEEHQALFAEVKRVQGLQKQIAYQRRLLKI